MKHPANVNKVYPSRKIALLRNVIPACLFLLFQLLVAAISYKIFWYLFEWNHAMHAVNYYVDFDSDFFFTAEKFKHIAFWSLTAVALALFFLNMKRYLWNQVIFLCFTIALYLALGSILFQHAHDIVNAGGTWNVSAGVPDEVRMENLRRNAEKGNAEAMYTLGRKYLKGWGLKKDEAEAAKWFRLAAEQGYDYAMYELGCCYMDGTGVEQDDAEAVKWFVNALGRGEKLAAGKLQTYEEKGDPDAKKALETFIRTGDPESMFDLAWMYDDGRIVEKDSVRAAKWYRHAAERGLAPAQREYGLCLESGNGVEANMAEAVNWYRLAAAQGDGYAERHLKRLAAEGHLDKR